MKGVFKKFDMSSFSDILKFLGSNAKYLWSVFIVGTLNLDISDIWSSCRGLSRKLENVW